VVQNGQFSKGRAPNADNKDTCFSISILLTVPLHKKWAKMVGLEEFEPSTIGLKDSYLIFQVFINQSLTVFVHIQCASKRR